MAKINKLFATILLFSLTPLHAAFAQAPTLGAADSFAILGAQTVTNTGPTIITGDLGVSPGTAITGFPPGLVIGATHATDAVALQAQTDTTAAYNVLAGQACDATFGVPMDIGGLTLVPGVYCFLSSAQLTGTVTLDAQGDPDAVWVFKIASTLITASDSTVLLVNGAQPCNVFWQVGSSATIGTDTTFVGNILALTSISLQTNATIAGRALARNGAVTMDSNLVTVAMCSIPPATPIPPTIGKAFSPNSIDAGGTSTLTLTLSNADTAAASLTAPLTDTLPTGVLIASGGSNTCGGTVTAVPGSSSVTLTGGSIPAGGSCVISVDVTAAVGGNYINAVGIGALQTSSGSNAAVAAATLTVVPSIADIPPTLGKAFSPATINKEGASTLTITLSNTNATSADLSAPLTDTLPSGVFVSGGGSNTCGGTVTAVTGGSSVTLTGGSIAAHSSCTVTVIVTAADGGSYINSLAAGSLQTSHGNNVAPVVATLTVLSDNTAPTLGKAFDPATIDVDGTSTLTITLSNTNSAVAVLTAPLVDTLPSGVLVSSGGSNTCGGTVSAVTGGSSVTLTGGSIPANGSCTITVTVTAAIGGNFINSLAVGALQTDKGSNAAPVVATLTVLSVDIAPTLSKAFSPATINADESSALTITLSNPNSTAATLTAPLKDVLPVGVVVASGGTNTCNGTVTAVSGSSSVTLTGGSIPAHGSCTVTVNVTASISGNFVNSLAAGELQTNKGINAAPAVATLTVVPVVANTSDFECHYFLSSKGGDLSCTASGTVCASQSNRAICGKHRLNVECSNDFLVEDTNARNSLDGNTLIILGSEHRSTANLQAFDFMDVPGEYQSSLSVRDRYGFWANIYGSCEFR